MKKINPVILILAVALLLRLWKATQFFSFNFDEEYQASLAWEQVKNFHVIWIGVSASNLGYYLGPGFTYLNAFLFWLSKGDPGILAYFSGLWGTVTAMSIYYVVRDIYSKKAAFFSAIIYAGSILIAFFDRRFWNPTPIPFISIWMVYSLIKAQKDTRWFILSAILMASSFHSHLSLMVFWPILLYAVFLQFKRIAWKTWFIMIGCYLAITSPLIVFDLVHNFDNFLAPLHFLQKGNEVNHSPNLAIYLSHWRLLMASMGRIWFLKLHTNIQEEQNLGPHGLITQPSVIFVAMSFLILLHSLKSRKNNPDTKFLSYSLIAFAFGIIFYPGVTGEYFLLAFITLLTVVIGVFLSRLPKTVGLSIIVLFLIGNMAALFTSNQEKYGLETRRKLISETMKYVGNLPYSLETYGKDPRKYHPYGGWRYLFKTYGRAPNQSFADEFFGWIYPDEIKNAPSTLKVIVMEEKDYKTDVKPLAIFTEGAFKAYVFKNK